MRYSLLALACCLLASPLAAQDTQPHRIGAETRESLSLTIYNGGFAMVRDSRAADLPDGALLLELADVSAKIQPETAVLRADGLRVLEQNFDFDLMTPQALIRKAVGQTVRIHRPHPQTGEDRVETARVLAANDGVILDIDGRIEILDRLPGRIVFTDLPPKLRARPTLSTRVELQQGGRRTLDLTYLTEGLTWDADYTGVLSAEGDRLDLTGWITLTNESGTDFANATTQVVAGDLNRARQESGSAVFVTMARAVGTPDEATREALGDYHLYTLPHPTTVADNQTKQVAFLGAPDVGVTRRYIHRTFGLQTRETPVSVPVSLELENSEANGLGLPLPKGVVRVYGHDSSGAMQFLGGDDISHTPKDRPLNLTLGKAFDVTVESRLRAQDYIVNTRDRKLYDATQAHILRNAGEKAIELQVRQAMPGDSWSITEESHPHTRRSAREAEWTVSVPAGGEVELVFSVRIED